MPFEAYFSVKYDDRKKQWFKVMKLKDIQRKRGSR